MLTLLRTFFNFGTYTYPNDKGIETQHLSLSDIVERITSYLTSVSREECCVFVENKARKFNHLLLLHEKPYIVNKVALAMHQYFNLEKEERNLWLGNKQSQINILITFRMTKKGEFPIFVGKPMGNKSVRALISPWGCVPTHFVCSRGYYPKLSQLP